MNDPETPAAPEPPPSAPSAEAAPQPYQASTRASPAGYVFFLGLLLLLTGVIWYVVEQESTITTKVWIFGALLLMLVPLAWHASDFVKSVTSRRGAAFGFVALTIVLGVAVAGFVGWASVEFKAKLPSFDLTRSSRFSLSDETTKLLDKVEGTVFITYLSRGDRVDPPDLRSEALEQIRVYEAASSRVRVGEADDLRNREAAERVMKEAGVAQTTSGEDTDLIVLTYAEPGKEPTPGKQKEVKVEKWAFYKTSSTGEDKWLGESVISNALYELVFQKLKAYATGGHGERSLSADFHKLRDALTTQNIDVETTPVNLATAHEVPKDCELLLVLDPRTPFSVEEETVLARWLAQGKTLLLTMDVQPEKAPNGLEPLLDSFGVTARAHYEVVAPQMEAVEINGRQVVLPRGMGSEFVVFGQSYADHPAAKALRARSGLSTYFFKSTFVEIAPKPPEDASPEAVCFAPEQGQFTPVALQHYKSRTDYRRTEEGKDIEGQKFPLIVTSARKATGPDGHDARLIISGDTDVFSDRAVDGSPANLDLARGLVQWGLRREGLVAVSDRTLEFPYVVPDERQRRFAQYWPLFVCLLPLIAGGMVWWSRRR